MTVRDIEMRNVIRARQLAEYIEHCDAPVEIDYEGKRLNILLGCLSGNCHCEYCVELVQAYAASRRIYQAQTIKAAHTAAHRVADILAHVA